MDVKPKWRLVIICIAGVLLIIFAGIALYMPKITRGYWVPIPGGKWNRNTAVAASQGALTVAGKQFVGFSPILTYIDTNCACVNWMSSNRVFVVVLVVQGTS